MRGLIDWSEAFAAAAEPRMQGRESHDRIGSSSFIIQLRDHCDAGRARLLASGASGFFATRPLVPWLHPAGTIEATSFYDTAGLKRTLERLVDFDRLNAGMTRLSVGAVNVRTGNFVYFDSAGDIIRPEHVMASGALPPGFPAVEIDCAHYCDGALVSNTPLQWVVDYLPRRSRLSFQVDLFHAHGCVPTNLDEVNEREKDIRYSGRTRACTEALRLKHDVRHNIN